MTSSSKALDMVVARLTVPVRAEFVPVGFLKDVLPNQPSFFKKYDPDLEDYWLKRGWTLVYGKNT